MSINSGRKSSFGRGCFENGGRSRTGKPHDHVETDLLAFLNNLFKNPTRALFHGPIGDRMDLIL